MCGPWEPAFDSKGHMALGFNSYLGPRFPMIYEDPLTNPLPIAAVADLHSQPLSARFDPYDNLYILDHNRSRVLIYRTDYETYSLEGYVKDENLSPIQGIRFTIESPGYKDEVTSNSFGRFEFSELPPGNYLLTPNHPHYMFQPSNRSVKLPGTIGSQDFLAIKLHINHLPLIGRQP